MRNKYAGSCRECSGHVAEGAGYFERHGGGWRVRCIPCTAKAKRDRGDSLSFAQRDALNPKCPNHGWPLPCKTCGFGGLRSLAADEGGAS
jgi:NAD-dependent SIR2 family protein deacetylase